MPIFGHGKSTDWHQQVDATANGQHPCTSAGELNLLFPWIQLEQHTSAYIKKKGKLATLERDKKLAALIREHDAKDIAVAACALLMSPIYLRDMVRQELNIHPSRSQDLQSYLQVVVAASHQSPDAIDRQEAQRALLLIPFCSRPDAAYSSSFRALMLLFTDLIPSRSIIYPHIEEMTRKACISFVTQLEDLKNASLWQRAHDLTEWLSTLNGVSLSLSAPSLHLLQDHFPTWQVWASWQPSVSRLQLWNLLDREKRTMIQDFLALEGPDFTNSGKSTLREGLIDTRHVRGSKFVMLRGNIQIELRDGESRTACYIIDLLMWAIDIVSVQGDDAVNLLAHFCVGTVVDVEGLHILKLIYTLHDKSITSAILRLHNARTANREERLAAILQLLPTLDTPNGEELRNVLAPYLRSSTSDCLEELQNDLGRVIEAEEAWEGTESRLQEFGQGVKNITWIRPLLDISTQEMFDCWPTKQTIDALRDLRTAALKVLNGIRKDDVSNDSGKSELSLEARYAKLRQNVASNNTLGATSAAVEEAKNDESLSLVKFIDQYCVDVLIVQDAISPLHRTLVDAFIVFWQTSPDENRYTIALIVCGNLTDDIEYIRRILTKLPALPNDFVVKLRAQLQQYVGNDHRDVACVNLARMLASTHLYDAIASWKPVLDQMINKRGQRLFDYAMGTLDTKCWTQWLGNLRQIYGSAHIGSPKSSPPLRWSRLMEWGRRLENYISTINDLQAALGPGDWLSCIRMGHGIQLSEGRVAEFRNETTKFDFKIDDDDIQDDWLSWGKITSKNAKKAKKNPSKTVKKEDDLLDIWATAKPKKKKAKKANKENNLEPPKNEETKLDVDDWDWGFDKKVKKVKTVKTVISLEAEPGQKSEAKLEADNWSVLTLGKEIKKDLDFESNSDKGEGMKVEVGRRESWIPDTEVDKATEQIDTSWAWDFGSSQKDEKDEKDTKTYTSGINDWGSSWGFVKTKKKVETVEVGSDPLSTKEVEADANSDDDWWFNISKDDREKGKKIAEPAPTKVDVKSEHSELEDCWKPLAFKKTKKPDENHVSSGIEGVITAEGLEDILVNILQLLKLDDKKLYQPIFHKAISSLKRDGANAAEIYSIMSLVTTTTTYGLDACKRVLGMYEKASPQVAKAFLGLYKNSNEMRQSDVAALNAVAKILAMDVDPRGNVDGTSLDAATDYLVDQFNEIYEEARRLEDLRVAFKAADPEGTAALLESLEIEDSTPSQDALASLPAALVDLVEMVGDEAVEMQIPLTLTALQRVALGVGTANNIIVRLNLPESQLPLAFCIHLDNESKANTGAHRPWVVSDGNRAPAVPVCFGRPNRALYQLSRALFRHLQAGYESLADVHRVLIASLKDIAHHCMVCGTPLGAVLRRSTLCKSADCVKVFARSRLAIRLSDIQDDTLAVDAILTLVYAAAASNKPELLPGCPIADLQTVKQILNLMPAVSQLKNVSDLSVVFKSRHAQTEELLSWALNSHRGFFTSASGHLRIPGMAGAHQFIMASVAPELEAAFAAQVVLNGGTTRVVFHATSLDRVFSILTQGLQIHSNSSLQRTGAYYGRGIYVAEEPSTASGYFAAHNAAAMWSAGTLKNVRVLLGCELAGSGTVPANTKIHVVTNPSQLIVRHVFLMPPTAVVPTLATHVTPAMGSVFSFLRSSAP